MEIRFDDKFEVYKFLKLLDSIERITGLDKERLSPASSPRWSYR